MAKKDRRTKGQILDDLLVKLGKNHITVEEYRRQLFQHSLKDKGCRGDDVDLYLRGLLK